MDQIVCTISYDFVLVVLDVGMDLVEILADFCKAPILSNF